MAAIPALIAIIVVIAYSLKYGRGIEKLLAIIPIVSIFVLLKLMAIILTQFYSISTIKNYFPNHSLIAFLVEVIPTIIICGICFWITRYLVKQRNKRDLEKVSQDNTPISSNDKFDDLV
ncbi:MAG TPA: hypothetical protein VLX68_03610 [Chitinivibrionales bacterium]|nr:hypothetical protein [Chitinivibrionales bacterium]